MYADMVLLVYAWIDIRKYDLLHVVLDFGAKGIHRVSLGEYTIPFH